MRRLRAPTCLAPLLAGLLSCGTRGGGPAWTLGPEEAKGRGHATAWICC